MIGSGDGRAHGVCGPGHLRGMAGFDGADGVEADPRGRMRRPRPTAIEAAPWGRTQVCARRWRSWVSRTPDRRIRSRQVATASGSRCSGSPSGNVRFGVGGRRAAGGDADPSSGGASHRGDGMPPASRHGASVTAAVAEFPMMSRLRRLPMCAPTRVSRSRRCRSALQPMAPPPLTRRCRPVSRGFRILR